MKRIATGIIFLITPYLSFAGGSYVICKLPRPNSIQFTFEEAEKRKAEIYSMRLTPKYFDWDNPTGGGSIHITKDDRIEVYNCMNYSEGGVSYFYMKMEKGGIVQPAKNFAFLRDGTQMELPPDYYREVASNDVLKYVRGIHWGAQSGVLITSEMNLNDSKSFKLLMDQLFKPSVQLYYISKVNGAKVEPVGGGSAEPVAPRSTP